MEREGAAFSSPASTGASAMRRYTWSLLGTLAVAAATLAQGTAPPPAVPPAGANDLNGVLRGWEKAMTDLKSFAVTIDRGTVDKVLGAGDQFKGYALFRKEGTRARLELAKVNNPKVFEKYI